MNEYSGLKGKEGFRLTLGLQFIQNNDYPKQIVIFTPAILSFSLNKQCQAIFLAIRMQ